MFSYLLMSFIVKRIMTSKFKLDRLSKKNNNNNNEFDENFNN